ncbi:MAG: hypothetical protein P4L62_01140 [Candidatus Pacebacteria bacterium]|nr:hypothetical protein [Candidatus Paceibacterota bacterium]
MSAKKTKPARNAASGDNFKGLMLDKNFASQYENDYWRHSAAGGAEKRENKKKPKMPVSGKSVLKIREIIIKKTKPRASDKSR